MGEYYNRTQGPLSVTLRSGNSVSVPAKGRLVVGGEDESSPSLLEHLARHHFVKVRERRTAPVPVVSDVTSVAVPMPIVPVIEEPVVAPVAEPVAEEPVAAPAKEFSVAEASGTEPQVTAEPVSLAQASESVDPETAESGRRNRRRV